MTHRILRFPLVMTDRQEILIPEPAQVTSVAVSRDAPNMSIDLWALCEDGAQHVRVKVAVVGTGHPLPGALTDGLWEFVGTVVTTAGLVWHVWVEKRIR